MALPSACGHHPIWIEQNSRERANLLPLLEPKHPSPPAHTHHSCFSALWTLSRTYAIGLPILRPSGSERMTPPALLVPQITDSKPWDFSTSIIVRTYSCTKAHSMHLSLPCWFCFSGEPMTNASSRTGNLEEENFYLLWNPLDLCIQSIHGSPNKCVGFILYSSESVLGSLNPSCFLAVSTLLSPWSGHLSVCLSCSPFLWSP